MTTTCPVCQLSFDPSRNPGGHCPRCLLLGGRDETQGDLTEEAPPLRVCPAMEDLAGDFPVYEIEALIGRGGMGAVYRARHRELDRLVAIKVLLVDLAGNEDFERRFRREARILAKLDHPNIVRLYDYGRTPSGMCFLVMELVEGQDISRLIRERGITVGKAMGMVIEICEALQYAHERGLVHRDIKPSNVLVDKNTGRVHIADFGLAKLGGREAGEHSVTGEGRAVGTPLYMAPEQRTAGDVDHRADIYSLGVMLYEMLTGEVPQGVFREVSEKAPVHPRFNAVVRRAMRESPADRYQAASEVKAAVAAIPLSGGSRRRKSRRFAALAAGALVLAAAGAFTVWKWSSPDEKTAGPSSDPAAHPFTTPFVLGGLTPVARPFTPAEAADLTARLRAVNPGFPGLTPDAKTVHGDPRLSCSEKQVWLRLEEMQNLSNIEPLRDGPFTHVSLTRTDVTDISVVKTLPLRTFYVTSREGMDLTVLRDLHLSALTVIGPLGPVHDLNDIVNPKLTSLVIDLSQVTDLSPLHRCPSLTFLRAINCPRLTSLEPLRGMPLITVNILGSPVTDLSPLLDNPNLTDLQCDAGTFNAASLAAYLFAK